MKSHRHRQVLVIQKLNVENITRHILLSASLTVSTTDATVVALQHLEAAYTGHDKATVTNHFNFVSVRYI